MAATLTATQAAHLELAGNGSFSLAGRRITFRTVDGAVFNWFARTDKDAATQLRVFRAAPKYTVAS
jgi:hypothetical protein